MIGEGRKFLDVLIKLFGSFHKLFIPLSVVPIKMQIEIIEQIILFSLCSVNTGDSGGQSNGQRRCSALHRSYAIWYA
jgi:hypothetical protein